MCEAGINWKVRPPSSRLPALDKPFVSQELHFNTSIANLLILRGKEVHSADLGKQKLKFSPRLPRTGLVLPLTGGLSPVSHRVAEWARGTVTAWGLCY